MGAPVRSEVHVGGQAVAGVQTPMVPWASGIQAAASGLSAALTPASTLQTVYACGAQAQRLTVVCLDTAARAVYTAQPDAPQPVVGIIQHKPTPTTAIVVSFGPVTGFAGLAPGKRYFLLADGQLTAPPLVPLQTPYVHAVGVALTDSVLFVMPQWPLIKRAPEA